MAGATPAHGKNPRPKTLAAGLIPDQEEIAMMRDWLKQNGK